jgi:hypothetical protein
VTLNPNARHGAEARYVPGALLLGEAYGDKPPGHWNKIGQNNYEIARERLRALSEEASA